MPWMGKKTGFEGTLEALGKLNKSTFCSAAALRRRDAINRFTTNTSQRGPEYRLSHDMVAKA